ncbi:unnamed protein product [Pleuronectes platessa]|uniref:Uncharacterized protein n=1 Tax=Pleuronectes platessa TaxID=8262 RepID=A0A9N7Z9T0_PLEPL|nr:unnamed protein product [Pleuronectes platessa]
MTAGKQRMNKSASRSGDSAVAGEVSQRRCVLLLQQWRTSGDKVVLVHDTRASEKRRDKELLLKSSPTRLNGQISCSLQRSEPWLGLQVKLWTGQSQWVRTAADQAPGAPACCISHHLTCLVDLQKVASLMSEGHRLASSITVLPGTQQNVARQGEHVNVITVPQTTAVQSLFILLPNSPAAMLPPRHNTGCYTTHTAWGGFRGSVKLKEEEM